MQYLLFNMYIEFKRNKMRLIIFKTHSIIPSVILLNLLDHETNDMFI